MCDGDIETKEIVEISHISLDLAWILTLFSLTKTGLFSKDESGYINIELTKVFKQYMKLEGDSCLTLLKDKYIHYPEFEEKVIDNYIEDADTKFNQFEFGK